MKRLSVVTAVFLSLCCTLAIAFVQQEHGAFQALMNGNKRFVAGKTNPPDLSTARKKGLVSGQKPSAIVVTCSDSRVAPEHIFNQGLGDIFVIRTAGNVLDPMALGSIEYAAEHLHARLLVIMGHEQCGAVAAAMSVDGKPEGNIGAILAKILPAVEKVNAAGGTKDEIMNKAIRENITLSHNFIFKQSPILKHLAESGELQVVDAVYHLGSGEVELLATSGAPVSPHDHAAVK
jgi:carbonic anhydrase